MRTARLHRHNDNVAISLPEGGTQYLTANDAMALGELLMEYARDIKAAPASQTSLGSQTLALMPTDTRSAQSNRDYTEARARRQGSADAQCGYSSAPEKYGALPGSAWETWYVEAYNRENELMK